MGWQGAMLWHSLLAQSRLSHRMGYSLLPSRIAFIEASQLARLLAIPTWSVHPEVLAHFKEFGMPYCLRKLGDINIAEPNALIGFAGPRVVKETIGKDLPEGFQRSEFLLEHGFLDAIVERKELKAKVAFSLRAMGDFAKAE